MQNGLILLNLEEISLKRYTPKFNKSHFSKIYKGVSIDITMNLNLLKKQNPLARYPRLDTVLMVEGAIKKHDGEFRKKRLWEILPKKIMYQTFSLILDYLIVSRKISVDSQGKIGWIFYPDDVEKRLKKTHLFWKGNEK